MVDVDTNPAQFDDADEDIINNNKTLASLKQVEFNIVNKNESEVHNQEGLNDYSDDDFGDEDDEYYSDLDEDGKNYSQSKGPNSQVLSFI
jgi:hypothetical protein